MFSAIVAQYPSSARLRQALAHRSCRNPNRISSGRNIIRVASASLHSSNGSYGSNGSNGSSRAHEEVDWVNTAFPSYMASQEADMCNDFEDALTQAESSSSPSPAATSPEERRLNTVWTAIRREAAKAAAEEPMLSSFLYASVMAHDSLERALAFVLANRLANTTMLPTQLLDLFYHVITTDPPTRSGALADIEAFRERDPACSSYSQALLYYKGFHAIQTHRIAHCLWNRGQRIMALALQSRMSEVLAVDIHPAARIGKGLLLDHGTGVVIGETAVIGNNVSLLQNVTLGGTGKDVGDRHPKLHDNVLVGANATILGNIVMGRGAQVAAGSLVLKAVPPNTIVAGTPAKQVGKVKEIPAATMGYQLFKDKAKYLQSDPFYEEKVVAKAQAELEPQFEATPLSDGLPAAAPVAPGANPVHTPSAPHPPEPRIPVPVSAAVLHVNLNLGSSASSTPLEGTPEQVQATRDDREAERLWRNSFAEPEYFI